MASFAPAATVFDPAPAARARPRAVTAWLFALAAIVFAMVVVGGITRLTESGLSIVRWDPVGGIVPPLSPADWAQEYAAYRTSPQGVLVNAGMGMAAFKGIFFWEYLHRVIARVFVTALVVPLAWFVARRTGARRASAAASRCCSGWARSSPSSAGGWSRAASTSCRPSPPNGWPPICASR